MLFGLSDSSFDNESLIAHTRLFNGFIPEQQFGQLFKESSAKLLIGFHGGWAEQREPRQFRRMSLPGLVYQQTVRVGGGIYFTQPGLQFSGLHSIASLALYARPAALPLIDRLWLLNRLTRVFVPRDVFGSSAGVE